jgi:hypothetical protein
MVEAYLSDEMAESEEHKEQLHRAALDYYNAWQADRRRRQAEYDTRVDAYHADLDRARAEVEARDRAQYRDWLASQQQAAE